MGIKAEMWNSEKEDRRADSIPIRHKDTKATVINQCGADFWVNTSMMEQIRKCRKWQIHTHLGTQSKMDVAFQTTGVKIIIKCYCNNPLGG